MPVNPDGGFTSPIFFDRVTIASADQTVSRVMTGAAVGNVNGVTIENSVPQLTATAYLKGVPVGGVSFLWESSNPDVCTVDQSGNCTRVANTNNLTYDSNGAASLRVQANESFLGGLVQISATALRPDGSPSGVRGVLNIAVQAQAFRQFAAVTAGHNGVPHPAFALGTFDGPNAYNLVATSQPPNDQSA